MSTLLDFVQTLAIINLQNTAKENYQEFNPHNLETKEFIFYTLTIFDIKNPELTLSALKYRKEGEDILFQQELNFYKRAPTEYPPQFLEKLQIIKNQYNNERNKIFLEIENWYNTLSEKSNFIVSQYHVDYLQQHIDKLVDIENKFKTEYNSYYDEVLDLQNKRSNMGCLYCFLGVAAIIITFFVMLSRS